MENRDFKGIWIPREVWFDKRLSPLDKMILMEIDSLDNENHCYASNQYLAEFCGCSERQITATISKLTELKFIEVVKFDGRTRVLKSNLRSYKFVQTDKQKVLRNTEKSAIEGSKKCEAKQKKLRTIHYKNTNQEKSNKKCNQSISQVQKDEPQIQEPRLDNSSDMIDNINNTEHNSDTPINIFANPMNIPQIVSDKIHLDELKSEHVNQEPEIIELYNIVCQVLTTYNTETIRIAKQNVNITTVKQAFSLLDKSHFEYILSCLSKNYKISGNPKNYFITTLFNSVRTKPFFDSYNDRYSQKNKEKSFYEKWFEQKINNSY